MKRLLLSITFVLVSIATLEASDVVLSTNLVCKSALDTKSIHTLIDEIKRQTDGISAHADQVALFERNAHWLDLPWDQLVTINGRKIIISWWIDLLDDKNQQERHIKTRYYLQGGKSRKDAMISFLQERMINIATFAERLCKDQDMASSCNPFDWCVLNHQALGCYIDACESFNPLLADIKKAYGDTWNKHKKVFDTSSDRDIDMRRAQEDAQLMKVLKESCEDPVLQEGETRDEASMRIIYKQFEVNDRYKSIPWLRDITIHTQCGTTSLEEFVLAMVKQDNAYALAVAREWWAIMLQSESIEYIADEIEFLPILYKAINPFSVARVFSDAFDSLGAEVESLCNEGDMNARKIKGAYTETQWNAYKKVYECEQAICVQPVSGPLERPLLKRSKGDGVGSKVLHDFFLHLQSEGFKVTPGQTFEELIAESNAGMAACLEVQACMQGDWILTSQGKAALKKYAQASFMAKHVERIKKELSQHLAIAFQKDLSKEQIANFEDWIAILDDERIEFDGLTKICGYQELLAAQKNVLNYRVQGTGSTCLSSRIMPKLFVALCFGSFIYALYTKYQQKKGKPSCAMDQGVLSSHVPSET